jgi:uncharacterized protein YjbI with pentapeptide repeats
MLRVLRDAALAIGFLPWRFSPSEDALVVVVKGTYRLHHGGRATPAETPEPPTGDVFSGDEPRTSACRYASDLVPFKPKADAMLVGKVYAPEGRAVARCTASFTVGKTSHAIVATGDRYWLAPPSDAMSDPVPFTELALGYERSFGGPSSASNPAGRGLFDASAREAIARPLPNFELASEPVRSLRDRPAPAGFGPLSPLAADRLARWPRTSEGWESRWPWPPEGNDYSYFNAAPPALQVDGYLRGDEPIVCGNLKRDRRRFESALPGVRPRAFVEVRDGDLREVGLRLDTLWIDLETDTLVLVWRGSVPVKSARFAELDAVYVAEEPLDTARAPVAVHRERFERLRREAEPANDKATEALVPMPPPIEAPARNDNDRSALPPPKLEPAKVSAPSRPLLPPAMRKQLEEAGAPAAVLEAIDAGDLDKAQAAALAASGQSADSFNRLVERADAELRKRLVEAGADPSLLDPPAKKPKPKPKKAAPAPASDAWSRARVEAALVDDASLAEADLTGLDLSKLDLRGRDLQGAILADTNLDDARLDEAKLAGANLAGASAVRASFRAAELAEANLAKAMLREAILEDASLEGAQLDDAVLAGAKLARVRANKAYLRRVDLTRADLAKAELRDARLDGATLVAASLVGANLTAASAERVVADGVDLQDAKLARLNASEGSRFVGAKLRGADAERSRWAGADLQGMDLSRSILRGADFAGAHLGSARLDGADAFDADFTGAKLFEASLEGTNLRECRLDEADLRRANLQRASLYQASLLGAQLAGANLGGAFTAGTLLESSVRGWAG